MQIFSFISTPLGWLLRFIYDAVGSYGLSLILFTIVTKVLLFPLSIGQQKSMAKQAAYQPMIDEIRKKWANDKNRQNEELVKMQKEYGFSPTAGCLPLLVQLPIMIGLIDVIYKPMRYILGFTTTLIGDLQTVCQGLGELSKYSPQSTMINLITQNPDKFTKLLSAEQLASVQNFDMVFMGIDLSAMPTFAFNLLLLVPLLAGGTMLLQQFISTKLNGTGGANAGQMLTTAVMTSLMFVYISFKIPVGVSMYWIFGNIFGIIQSFILFKMYNPADYKAKLAAEIEAKKAARKKKTPVTVTKEDGTKTEVEVTGNEMDRLRLERARQLDREKYGDE